MIREQREKYSWQFIFLGANQDAIATAAKMGVGAAQSLDFCATSAGTQGMFDAFTKEVLWMRESRFVGEKDAIIEFDEEDRNAAAGELFR